MVTKNSLFYLPKYLPFCVFLILPADLTFDLISHCPKEFPLVFLIVLLLAVHSVKFCQPLFMWKKKKMFSHYFHWIWISWWQMSFNVLDAILLISGFHWSRWTLAVILLVIPLKICYFLWLLLRFSLWLCISVVWLGYFPWGYPLPGYGFLCFYPAWVHEIRASVRQHSTILENSLLLNL